jgi:6-phosphogluconolactonase
MRGRRNCHTQALVLLVVWILTSPLIAGGSKNTVYVGTLSRGTSKGIYAFRLDSGTGRLDSLGLAAETVNPAFLAIHPNRGFLYAVGDIPDSSGRKIGTASAFAIDPRTGGLALLNRVPACGGDPTYVCTDRAGKHLLVANYVGGSIAVIKIRGDGSLGDVSASVQHSGSSIHPKRQQKPYPHCILVSPDDRYVLVSDLGLDQILVYRFNAETGSLSPNSPPYISLRPGAGPRHFAFHPNGKFLYSINELQSTLTAFAYDASTGTLKELQTVSALPEGYTGESTASEVLVHPNGRFLYGANRGQNSIAVFSIDAKKGTLALVERIPTRGRPRNFRMDPDGSCLIVANQESETIDLLQINRNTGRLYETGQSYRVSWPWCVKFLSN